MSADNYLFVRNRGDGTFGVSMRFASTYYRDTDGGDSVPDDWFCDPPEDEIISDKPETALILAHQWHAKEVVVEYGVCVGEGVV
jgi:hypothetical protein